MKKYPVYIVDAFTEEPLSGNAAGVVLLKKDEFPDEKICIKAAAELKHSETAFVREVGESEYQIKYYTPVCEAALCGHATVAAFTALRESGLVEPGDKLVHTSAGEITVTVENDAVWLDMAEAKLIRRLNNCECRSAFGRAHTAAGRRVSGYHTGSAGRSKPEKRMSFSASVRSRVNSAQTA